MEDAPKPLEELAKREAGDATDEIVKTLLPEKKRDAKACIDEALQELEVAAQTPAMRAAITALRRAQDMLQAAGEGG